MSNESIYIVHGGFLKKGHIKIGRTGNCDELLKRYSTYYGSNVIIKFVNINNTEQIEKLIMEKLKEKYKYDGEIFKCLISEAEIIVKEITNKKRMKICKLK